MVVHQHECMQPHAKPSDHLPKNLQEMQPVAPVPINGFPFVTAGADVKPTARLLNPQRPCHGYEGILPTAQSNCIIVRCDPIFAIFSSGTKSCSQRDLPGRVLDLERHRRRPKAPRRGDVVGGSGRCRHELEGRIPRRDAYRSTSQRESGRSHRPCQRHHARQRVAVGAGRKGRDQRCRIITWGGHGMVGRPDRRMRTSGNSYQRKQRSRTCDSGPVTMPSRRTKSSTRCGTNSAKGPWQSLTPPTYPRTPGMRRSSRLEIQPFWPYRERAQPPSIEPAARL